MQPLHIDCDTCSVRGPACGDCVVSVLLGLPGHRAAPAPLFEHPGPALVRAHVPRVELEGRLVGGAPLPADLDAEEHRALALLASADLLADVRVVPRAASARRAG